MSERTIANVNGRDVDLSDREPTLLPMPNGSGWTVVAHPVERLNDGVEIITLVGENPSAKDGDTHAFTDHIFVRGPGGLRTTERRSLPCPDGRRVELVFVSISGRA